MIYEEVEPELFYIDDVWYCSPAAFCEGFDYEKKSGAKISSDQKIWIPKGAPSPVLVFAKWEFKNYDFNNELDEVLCCIVPGAGFAIIPFFTMNECRHDTVKHKSTT